MSKPGTSNNSYVRDWLEPKPPIKLPTGPLGKPVAHVAPNQSNSGSSHARSQQNNCKPVLVHLKHPTPPQQYSHKMPQSRPPPQQQPKPPKAQTNQMRGPKPASQKKVVHVTQNTTPISINIDMNRLLTQNLSSMNLNVPTLTSTNHKPTAQVSSNRKPVYLKSNQPKSKPPTRTKCGSNQKHTNPRPTYNIKSNKGTVNNITNIIYQK